MIWYAQYNAIMILVMVVGVVLGFVFESVPLAVNIVVLTILLRIALAVLNFLSVALRGRPLFYQTKILNRD